MMENKDEKKVNLASEMLKTISAQIHLLVESGQFATVNDAVIETCYISEEHQVFKKFHEWKDEGKKIKKGSKGFPVWSRPLDIKKDEKAIKKWLTKDLSDAAKYVSRRLEKEKLVSD